MLSDYTPTSEYYAETIGKIATEYDNNLRVDGITLESPSSTVLRPLAAAAACEGNCSGSCSGSCSGGCSGSCKDSCKDSCTGSCSGSCKDGCKDACKGDCKTACSGSCKGQCAAECSGDCKDYCLGSCKTYCSGSCMGECTGVCENKCQKCQTYCQKEQSYVKNSGTNGKTFSWSSTVDEDATILISATDWNLLVDYVKAAAKYCASSVPSLTKANSGEFITADIFNNLDSGIGSLNGSSSIGTKTGGTNGDFIKASDFNALSSHYNGAQILSSLECCQLGETPSSEYGRNQPCKNGQTCQKGQSCTQQGERGQQIGP